jgi:hypothetical protein
MNMSRLLLCLLSLPLIAAAQEYTLYYSDTEVATRTDP